MLAGFTPPNVALPRDTQRTRLYRAETPLPGRRFATLNECEQYCDVVVGSLWWATHFPEYGLGERPRLRPGNGARSAFFRLEENGEPTITLPRRYRTTGVILHELAHWALHRRRDIALHGPEFARVLLELTAAFGGDERAQRMTDLFAEHRVRVASQLPTALLRVSELATSPVAS
jgi:putative metallohydrolase (TIGR04338 family)